MRLVRSVAGATALGFVLAAGLSTGPAGAQERLTIATGSAGGVFLPLGTGMAELISDNIPGVSATAEATGGSAENVRLVGTGSSSMGLAMADVAYYARTGTDSFEAEGAYEGLAGLMMTYTQVMHVLVPADSDIETMADLAGKRISPGPAGSGTAFMGNILLDVYGLTDDVRLDRLTHDQQSTALGDGRIDAAFFLFPPGGAAVEAYTTAHDARFIPIDDPEAIAKISEDFPFYAPAVIAANTYTGQDEPVDTLGVSVSLVVNADLDEETVYHITKLLNEQSEDLVQYHNAARAITTETALNGMPIELHPGARRYYEEIGHEGLKN